MNYQFNPGDKVRNINRGSKHFDQVGVIIRPLPWSFAFPGYDVQYENSKHTGPYGYPHIVETEANLRALTEDHNRNYVRILLPMRISRDIRQFAAEKSLPPEEMATRLVEGGLNQYRLRSDEVRES